MCSILNYLRFYKGSDCITGKTINISRTYDEAGNNSVTFYPWFINNNKVGFKVDRVCV